MLLPVTYLPNGKPNMVNSYVSMLKQIIEGVQDVINAFVWNKRKVTQNNEIVM